MKGDQTKALVRGARGKAKVVKAFASGLSKGAKEASRGLGPVLAALSISGIVGGELADRGMLSITIMGKRLPIIGTGLAILAFGLGIYMRKRPVARVLYGIGATFAVCQVVDVVKFGLTAKPAETGKK